MDMELTPAFQTAFQAALQPYFTMKDAFVASDAVQVAAFAKATAEKMKTLRVSDLGKMEQSHLSESITLLDAISADPDLINQRAHLVGLNQNLVALVMNIKSPSEAVYVQKCPMANSNKGPCG